MAEDGPLAQQPLCLVGVEIVARLRMQRLHPFDLVELLGEVGLHQAIGMLAPERPQRRELLGRRGGREAGRDDIGEPALPMPSLEQPLAVGIGALGRVAQPLGRVAIHAGLARIGPQAPRRRRLEEGVHALGMDGGIAADGGRAMGEGQVEVAARDLGGISGIAEAHLLGEGVGLEPVDQPLAPARDDGGLRIVHMGIDEARRDQRLPVIGHPRAGMGRAQRLGRTHGGDAPVLHQNGAVALVARRGLALKERIGREGQHLSEEQVGHGRVSHLLKRSNLAPFRGRVNFLPPLFLRRILRYGPCDS